MTDRCEKADDTATFLTKSDYALARSCPTKLYYRKLGYGSICDDNPYLEFLADGGFMVEAMATLLFEGGRTLGNMECPGLAFSETCTALDEDNAILFEAIVLHDNLLARVDILKRSGTKLHLIEVKSACIDSRADGPNPFRGTQGRLRAEWRPYLEDVAFQFMVLHRAFPNLEIIPFLCVADKAKRATADTTFDQFHLRRQEGNCPRSKPEVAYTGNIENLRRDHLLSLRNVSGEVQELLPEVLAATDVFAASLRHRPIRRLPPQIGQKCKGCEYRIPATEQRQSGFCQCWGSLADAVPHVLDLYRVDLLGGKSHDAVAELASEGYSGLDDVPVEILSGKVGIRQEIQVKYTARGKEYVSAELRGILSSHAYPLHFIDFEASRLALPYHAGMHPYELAAFQWSCHTIRSPKTRVEHSEWLNTEVGFPNFMFASSLREVLGQEGSIYIWSPYEIAVLREIRRQMQDYGHDDKDTAQWIDELISCDCPRVVDLCALAREHYFDPGMNGSLSIKYVLPAVWRANADLRAHPLFRRYVAYDERKGLLSPYDTLPSLPIGDREEVVREGTAAMRVYQDMIFGEMKGDTALRDEYRRLLLQYCELDTVAMVAIWGHWRGVEALSCAIPDAPPTVSP